MSIDAVVGWNDRGNVVDERAVFALDATDLRGRLRHDGVLETRGGLYGTEVGADEDRLQLPPTLCRKARWLLT